VGRIQCQQRISAVMGCKSKEGVDLQRELAQHMSDHFITLFWMDIYQL